MSFLDAIPRTVASALSKHFRDATYTAFTPAATGTSYDPDAPTSQHYRCKALRDSWGSYDLAQGLVVSADFKVLVLAKTLAVEPKEGDQIVLEGKTLFVVSDGGSKPAVSSDPASAVWTLRCRP